VVVRVAVRLAVLLLAVSLILAWAPERQVDRWAQSVDGSGTLAGALDALRAPGQWALDTATRLS
jgi:hypothetical protein